MRWFTRAWQRGDVPDDYDPVADYRRHLVRLRGQVPDAAYAFAASSRRHLAVDDAKLDRLEIDFTTSRIVLRLLNGDLPTGYGKLTLEFERARLIGATIEELRGILEDPKTEFLVHEVERVDEEIEVRFLLWPEGELTVRCSAVDPRWESIADRSRTAFAHEVVLSA